MNANSVFFKLNAKSGKSLDRRAKSYEQNAILNHNCKPSAQFREIEWHAYQNEWEAYEIGREIRMLKNEFELQNTAAVTKSAKLNAHKMNSCGQLTKLTENSYISEKLICLFHLNYIDPSPGDTHEPSIVNPRQNHIMGINPTW